MREGELNRLIDRTFHRHFGKEYGPLAWIADSVLHAVVELADGRDPSTVAEKFVRYNLKEARRRCSRRTG